MMRLALALFPALISSVQAFPDGAGGCAGGQAAVMGFHLDTTNGRIVSQETLNGANVQFRINGVVMEPSTTVDFEIGQDYTVEVETFEFPLRGALFRVQAPEGIDTAGALIPGENMKDADNVCLAPIVGTTHFNRELKTMMISTVRFDEPANGVIFDITGVFVNSPDGSVYVYDRYLANFVGSNEMPTVSPVPAEPAAPTSAPVTTETGAPTSTPAVAETEAPMSAPTSSPTSAPTSAPMRTPTSTPTSAPTSTPTSAPTLFPVVAETDTPTAETTDSPTASPVATETTDSPSASPAAAEMTDSPTASPVIAETTDSPTQSPVAAETAAPTEKDGKKSKKETNSPTAPPAATSAPPTPSPTIITSKGKGLKGSTSSKQKKKKEKSSKAKTDKKTSKSSESKKSQKKSLKGASSDDVSKTQKLMKSAR